MSATTESYTIPLLESSYGNIPSCSWPNHSSDMAKRSLSKKTGSCKVQQSVMVPLQFTITAWKASQGMVTQTIAYYDHYFLLPIQTRASSFLEPVFFLMSSFLTLYLHVIPNSLLWNLWWAASNFYPRDAMLARVIGIATCPSVRHAPVLCQNEES